MSIVKAEKLCQAQKSLGLTKLFDSQQNKKMSKQVKLDSSQRAACEKATQFSRDNLFNEISEKMKGVKSTSQLAQKTLTQLDYKRRINQNRQKIMKIKQKCAKILINSKSTNQSHDTQCNSSASSTHLKNSKNQHGQIQSDFNFSDKNSEAQFSQGEKRTLNRTQFIQFNDEGGIQRFRILKYINEGTSGKVYLAQNVKNSAVFSIKVIPRKLITKDSQSQLFRQIKIQMFLNHPNIIKLYHFFVDAENIYLILEPCLGNDLYKNMNNCSQGLTEKSIATILKQVCQAVQYMHKNDIIHRDIKPENILLHENVVKVCDFGWAIHSPLLRDTRCGTPVYSSPQMLKKQLYDSKIDVWCIGVLAYELIYRRCPFQIHHIQDLGKIIEEQVYFSKQVMISREAKSFITSCMNKNPVKRYSITQTLQHPFLCSNDKYRCTIAC